MRTAWSLPCLVVLLAVPLAAQEPTTPPSQTAPENELEPVEDDTQWPAQSWRMPEVEVVGEPASDLHEEELIGSYEQPRWTAHRRFPTTRIYVIPEGQVEVEYWMRIDEPKHGDTRVRNLYEIEFGLPWRFQFDFYINSIHDGEWEWFDETERAYELRWALADWGKIWANPTLYYEFKDRQDNPDKFEAKLLLGDEISEGWHWGSNLVYEKEQGGEEERELQLTGAISRTLADDKFSLGAEFKAAQVTNNVESQHRHEYYVGPSAQWKPSPRTHIDVAPLAGIGPDSGKYTVYFIFGYEF